MLWKPGIATSENWVSATASLPIAFAQVREDPRIDRRLLEETNARGRSLMIASGGETAAVLATLPIESLHLVDPNPAQIAMARVKLSMLSDTSTKERLMLLGHCEMDKGDRQRELERRLSDLGLTADALGPASLVAEMGPDFCARYEWLFSRLREILAPQRHRILDLLSLSDPGQQAECVQSGTGLGQALQQAFDNVMELSKLVEIFGPEATANPAMPFSEHFLVQTRMALGKFRANDNPFLHQLFLGQFAGTVWDWLDLPKQSDLCPLQFSHGMMSDVITTLPDASYDFIHLSNILDWVKPTEAEMLLNHVHRCLAPGGVVVIRQLNSILDIAAVPSGLSWRRDLAQELHDEDRSFFYRELHIGSRL
ncbi:MAG: DUF3419 family protein [Rubripirellula sp.]|nr:DUF3419 family protein [Rubripirellula sp.]